MRENLKKVIESLPKLPQRQDALEDQLRDLTEVANRLGMYDAADFLATRGKSSSGR